MGEQQQATLPRHLPSPLGDPRGHKSQIQVFLSAFEVKPHLVAPRMMGMIILGRNDLEQSPAASCLRSRI